MNWILRCLFCLLFFNTLSAASKPKPIKLKKNIVLSLDSIERKVPVNIPNMAKPVIILDPGHGGTDEGAQVRGILEKKITLRTSYLTKNHLEEMGYKVILTRARDGFISLSRRVEIANRRKPALFISVHFNASVNPIAKGIEVFYPNSKQKERSLNSKKLANCILFELIDQTEGTSRGVKLGNFQVIRETQMPAVLIEAGFITNGDERNLLRTEAYLDRIAKGIAQGIEKYLKS
jgi:N-acetylmuramoyl-L-alanine amidase